MGRPGFKTPLGKRKRLDMLFLPKTIEMVDRIAEKYRMTRTVLFELGACLICDMALEVLEAGAGE